MRIITGKYKGRKINCPEGQAVRPTSDKVRGAVFNVLFSHINIEGANVLDIFCGTGALGLESLSRGAEFCTFVDSAAESIKFTTKNLEKVAAENFEILQIQAEKLVNLQKKYDLVFIDPPYRTELAQNILDKAVKNNWLNEGAILVVETDGIQQIKTPDSCTRVAEKLYGSTKVSFLIAN